jgi:hypothetical protein
MMTETKSTVEAVLSLDGKPDEKGLYAVYKDKENVFTKMSEADALEYVASYVVEIVTDQGTLNDGRALQVASIVTQVFSLGDVVFSPEEMLKKIAEIKETIHEG